VLSESFQGERDPIDAAQLRRRRRRRAFWLTLIALAAAPTALQVEWWRAAPRLAVALQPQAAGEAPAGAAPRIAGQLPRLHADGPLGASAAKRCAYARWTPTPAGRAGAEHAAEAQADLAGKFAERATSEAGGPGLTLISNPNDGIIPTGIAGGDPATGDPTRPLDPALIGNRQPPPVVSLLDPTTPQDPGPLGPNPHPVNPDPLDPRPGDPGPSTPLDPLGPGPVDPGQPPAIAPRDPVTPVTPILPLTPVVNPPGGDDPGGPGNPGGPTLLPLDPRLPPGGDDPIRPLAPIPEPGTWAMLILGLGAVGVSLRRRRASA
jgi:hypothetical protein